MPLPKPNRSQLAVGVIVVIGLVILGGLAWAFVQQLTLAQQMRAEEMRLEQAVAAEQARHEELEAELEYVKSDEYVERWARVKARMVKPGEVAVVPLADVSVEEPQAEPQPAADPVPEPRPFWAELWEMVFGPAASSQTE